MTRYGEKGPAGKERRAAYDEGQQARKDGKLESDNPHPPKTSKHVAWRHGWKYGGDEYK